ncbi:MAG: hypothetical protein JWM92_104 [Candidatus Nomurabacteria bacterium]|jgi:hypothetical protein|nr:hypothetical protein [Candidatus Nomurabacteria bacterium]
MTPFNYQPALQYLLSQQHEDGSFDTTFYTGLIVNALEQFDDTISLLIKKRAVRFLLQEKSRQWSFNYDRRDAVDNRYPDDLDDTFVALKAISICRPAMLTGETWQAITALLIANEEKPAGPYQTWIMPLAARSVEWQDIDIVVNSNIASFLSRFNIVLPSMQEYFDGFIEAGNFSSRYYHHECIIVYFLSKAYRGTHAGLLRETLLKKRNENNYWDSAFIAALSVSALLALGQASASLTPAIQYIMDGEKDGQWTAESFFIESKSNSGVTYSVSAAHTTACCIEALRAYEAAVRLSTTASISNGNDTEETLFIEKVISSCKEIFCNSGSLLTQHIHGALDVLMKKDPHAEVILLPYHFSKNMMCGGAVSTEQLAVATTLGWIGYTFLDKTMDGEDTIGRLPLAAKCIRESYNIFQLFNKDHGSVVQRILDGIESAVLSEYVTCILQKDGDDFLMPFTLPDYGDYQCLAEKSLGFALAPIILCLQAQEYDQAVLMERFFIHYLIARQLNDDAHDWLEDLEHGFINSVSVDIIKDWHTQYVSRKLNMRHDKKILQTIFWEKHIDTVSTTIVFHCQKASDVLKKITVLADNTFLENLLHPLQHSATEALTERDKVRQFIYTLHTNDE